jgi:hypothetical protein
MLQALPGPHGAQRPPPQSVSVSAASRTPFAHAASSQTPDGPQNPLAQSAAMAQPRSPSHFEQEPPQSVSVSLPLRTPSSQLGATQRPDAQTPLAQSPP